MTNRPLFASVCLFAVSACAMGADLDQIAQIDPDLTCEIQSFALTGVHVVDNLDSTSARGEMFVYSTLRSHEHIYDAAGDGLARAIDLELPRLRLTPKDDETFEEITGLERKPALLVSQGEYGGLELYVRGDEIDSIISESFEGTTGVSLGALADGQRSFEVECTSGPLLLAPDGVHVLTATFEVDAECTSDGGDTAAQ